MRDSPALGRHNEKQLVPGLSAFNGSLTCDAVVRPSVIGYLPVITTSPTQLSTVYFLLKRSLALADNLKQAYVVVVLDQAIYALD